MLEKAAVVSATAEQHALPGHVVLQTSQLPCLDHNPTLGLKRELSTSERIHGCCTDIIYLPKYDERVPTCWKLRLAGHGVSASAWKAKGNHCFRQSKYHAAIEQQVSGDSTSSKA